MDYRKKIILNLCRLLVVTINIISHYSLPGCWLIHTWKYRPGPFWLNVKMINIEYGKTIQVRNMLISRWSGSNLQKLSTVFWKDIETKNFFLTNYYFWKHQFQTYVRFSGRACVPCLRMGWRSVAFPFKDYAYQFRLIKMHRYKGINEWTHTNNVCVHLLTKGNIKLCFVCKYNRYGFWKWWIGLQL